ncbi:hypothetical protein [Bacillus sp. RO1]|uniref:hypothetical protein n=1 Tax=Bacillus sp. RO1 TaxID=2722703 RepID=UPI001456C837|nr:hypothetical protein [Bacillus sp. RO1]NLP52041.1 hypothetical protein [Bacillus sp. RO1]
MAKWKSILNPRELDMIKHYQSQILELDIENAEDKDHYNREITHLMESAAKRHYKENPSLIPLHKNTDGYDYDSPTVRDLLTKEEEEELEFLKWRMTRALTPWGKKGLKKKINSIVLEAEKRNHYS